MEKPIHNLEVDLVSYWPRAKVSDVTPIDLVLHFEALLLASR